MPAEDRSVLVVLNRHADAVVSRVERVFYEFDARTEETDGDLQVHVSGGVLRFKASAGGETIELTETPWRDPFAGSAGDDGSEFVGTHGRWRLVDVSAWANYRELVGRRLGAALPLTNRFGSLIGVQLRSDEVTVNVFVDGDETCVSWGMDNIPRWGREWVGE